VPTSGGIPGQEIQTKTFGKRISSQECSLALTSYLSIYSIASHTEVHYQQFANK